MDLMSSPCEQKDTIISMKEDVTDVKGDIKELVSEFKELARDLRTTLVASGQLQTKVDTLIKDTDELWHEHRQSANEFWETIEKIREDLAPIKEWRAKIDDRFNTLKVIPILCTVITIMITMWNILYNAAENKQHNHETNRYYSSPQFERHLEK
jgi:predicted nuclease with TOPRIM domain